MKFLVTLSDAPYQSSLCQTALDFCYGLVKDGHEIARLFLYHDATYLALPMEVPAGEFNPHQAWLAFAQEHNIKLECCVAASQRRGISEVAEPFEISGLVNLAEAQLTADRVMQF